MTIAELAIELARKSAHYDAACRSEDYVQQCTLRETIEAMCFFHLKQIIEILNSESCKKDTDVSIMPANGAGG